jgi:hypothetical protein
MADYSLERPRVHAPLPAACVAERPAQGSLLRPLAPISARARSTSPSYAPARPSRITVTSHTSRRDDRPHQRSVGRSHTIRRNANLPMLSAGPPRSRRPPLPQTGKRTMTSIVFPQQSSRLSSQRAPLMPRPLCACRSPAFALSSWTLQNPPRITPLHRPMATIYPTTMLVRATSPSAHSPALN